MQQRSKQMKPLTFEPLSDYSNIESKTPYYLNPNKPPSSQSILPQSTKVTNLRTSFIGFTNSFFNNNIKKTFNKESTMPPIRPESVNKAPIKQSRDNSFRSTDISSSDSKDRLIYNKRSAKEEIKANNDYFSYNNYINPSFQQSKPFRNALVKSPIDSLGSNMSGGANNNQKITTPNFRPVIQHRGYNDKYNESEKTNHHHQQPPEHINITTLLSQQHLPLDISVLREHFTNYESSKFSTRANSSVKAYCANTHQGIIR
jgi:hypothetical protein